MEYDKLFEKKPAEVRLPMPENWARAEHFAHFMANPCQVNLTGELEVTALRAAAKAAGYRFYPLCIWLVSRIVNRHIEFRMTTDEGGAPCHWQEVSPAYVIFHPDTETFSGLTTPWVDDFDLFYARLLADMERYRDDPRYQIPSDCRATFDLSCLPWMDFTGFTLHLGSSRYLAPIFTWGGFREREGKTWMPMAVDIHHAAADGFHIARFFREFEQEAAALAAELMRRV